MAYQIPGEQKKRFGSFLANQRIGILSTSGSPGVWAMPVWYRPDFGFSGSRSLELECLVPRWADIAHHLALQSRVVFIVQAISRAGLRWLQIQGTARPVEAPDWARLIPRRRSTPKPDDLYLVVRITPKRIDLIDEELGWGVQETLEW